MLCESEDDADQSAERDGDWTMRPTEEHGDENRGPACSRGQGPCPPGAPTARIRRRSRRRRSTAKSIGGQWPAGGGGPARQARQR